MSTYKVAGKWNKGSFVDPRSGTQYTHRRWVSQYATGNPNPIQTSYEYKGFKSTGIIEPSGLPSGLTEDLIDPGDKMAPVVGVYDTSLTSPTGDPFITDMTSGEQALYDAYTRYLDQVDFYNQYLRNQVEYYYETSQAIYDYDDNEKDFLTQREYNRYVIPKRSFAKWLELTEGGTIENIEELYSAPKLDEEHLVMKDHPLLTGFKSTIASGFANIPKFWKGMKFGWEMADATGIPRIMTMGLAGMPDQLVRSMALSTATYGMTERLMGQQDQLTRSIADLSDSISTMAGSTAYTGEHYKRMYTQLNAQAKRRGIIKGDWTLRLSRNMPLKERWRRLYITLLAYIEKWEKTH